MGILDKVKSLAEKQTPYSFFFQNLTPEQQQAYLKTIDYMLTLPPCRNGKDTPGFRPSIKRVLPLFQEEFGSSPTKTTFQRDMAIREKQCQTS
jgi:hypothetical protein